MSAGGVPVFSSEQVALKAEDLHLRLTARRLYVDAQLTFVNDGPAVSIVMEFPCITNPNQSVVAGYRCGSRLRVSARGRRIRSRFDRAQKQPNAQRTWTVHFKANETVELRVKYSAAVVNDRYRTPFLGLNAISYQLATGALWKGSISELKIRVDLPTDAVVDIAPNGYTRSSRQIHWDLKNYEPTGNLIIGFSSQFTQAWLNLFGTGSARRLFKRAAKGRINLEKLKSMRDLCVKEARLLHSFYQRPLIQYSATIGLKKLPTRGRIRKVCEESVTLISNRPKTAFK